MKMMNKNWFAAACILGAVGCATSIQKADIPASANPSEEIAKLEADLSYGASNEFEVLDREDYEKSREHLTGAKAKLRDNDSQQEVLDEIRYSRAYFERAKNISASRRAQLAPALDSRNAALDAGVQKYPSLSDDWNSAEKESRSLAKERSEKVSVEDVRKLQSRYADLQFKAVKMNHLGDARAKIEAAKDRGAKSEAPQTLKQAELDYASAAAAIDANRTTPERFNTEVARANYSADRLMRVMAIYEKDRKSFSEPAAIQLVNQEDQINRLNGQLGYTQQELGATRESNEQLQTRVLAQGEQLTDAQKKVELQKAIENARKQFKPSEADVYQQGDKLLIRVKSLNFATGKAELPKNADRVLEKVEMVAKDLKAEEVVVQGHTDSTGSKEVNQKLSEERAEQVAKYFEKSDLGVSQVKAEGYGDSVPLGTNRTKTGRAQNRRIDVVISPSGRM